MPTFARGLPLFLAVLLLDCASPAPRVEVETDGDAVPWTGLDVFDDPDDFQFVLVTDRTGEHRDYVFRDAMPKINLLRPSFVMSVGDLIEGYTEDRAVLDAEWQEFEGFIA